MIKDSTFFASSIRSIKAKAVLKDTASAVKDEYVEEINKIEIERMGAGKFFGFGFCQRLSLELREISTTAAEQPEVGDKIDISFLDGEDYTKDFPTFYITERHKSETEGTYTITAYDRINLAGDHTVSEINLEGYNIYQFAQAIATLLGLSGIKTPNMGDSQSFTIYFTSSANFEGTENLREALDDIAEATQTFYYINNQDYIVFKRLDKTGDPQIIINKNLYFDLKTNTNRRLSKIVSTNELSDSISAELQITGTTQYIRDNAFLDLRSDIEPYLEEALSAIGNFAVSQFECEWRGNPYVEIGDKLSLIGKNNESYIGFLLNDKLIYDGGLTQTTQWEFEEEEEKEDSPSSLGDSLKYTYARVDKVDKNIKLLASQVEANDSNLSRLQLTTEDIQAQVSSVKSESVVNFESVDERIDTLTSQVEAKMTAEEVAIEISTALSQGVEKVETKTGFTLDENGLTISKSNSPMSTNVDQNGMTIYNNDDEVLVVNNVGVQAENLRATTYLIIGNHSRLEDFNGYTACFWIG